MIDCVFERISFILDKPLSNLPEAHNPWTNLANCKLLTRFDRPV